MKKYFRFLPLFLIIAQLQAQHRNLLIGTYTHSCESNGIYVYDFDSKTGKTVLRSTSEKLINPSYLTLSSDNRLVYSVNEAGAQSRISAMDFDGKNLKLINQQSSEGADPCYIINDAQNVIAANYSGGNISVFKKRGDGGISQAVQIIQHYGKGKNPQRQEKPHVHMVQFSPDKKFVLSNDLGTDQIYVYQYHPESATKILEIKDSVSVKSGSGPRHLTFSPNGKFAYLLQELDATLTVFSYGNGELKKIQETQITAPDFKGETSAADIHISPDGKFLYATNRGTANEISCFKIAKNGLLDFVESVPTLGKGPRNFTIDPSGNFVLVGHQYTNQVVIFKRDQKTGKLTDTAQRIDLCSPVCLVFQP